MNPIKKITFGAVSLAAFIISGCASHSHEISSTYVSPVEYEGYSCRQLQEESQRINRRVASLAGEIDGNASSDEIAMGVGMVVFWPALFFLEGDGEQAQEYSRLKGRMEAVETVAIRKDCSATNTPTNS